MLWVAFAISSLLTTLTMFQSPGIEYLIHYGLLFHYIVVALREVPWQAIRKLNAKIKRREKERSCKFTTNLCIRIKKLCERIKWTSMCKQSMWAEDQFPQE